jgi:L-alanine-DL-glutamate epimerase-like enolase superfamily enzyme
MTRRLFGFSLLPAALRAQMPKAVPRIRSIDCLPVDYPVQGHFKFFPKPLRPTVFVKITLEGGLSGWGQAVPVPTWSYETPESVFDTLQGYLAPKLIDTDPTDLAGAHRLMRAAIAPGFTIGMPIAKAAIDLALHDLCGKLAGVPLAGYWKRPTTKQITLSYTINPRTIEEVDALVMVGRNLGYQHFNLKVAPDIDFDVKVAKRVRQLAPQCFLWADANGGWDTETALKAAPRLADAGVNVLEQPVPANRLSGFAELKKQGALPIILDEGVVSSVELEEFIQLKMLDGLAFKPARTAGLYEALRQLDLCRKHNLMVLGSGLTDPDCALAAALHLYGVAEMQTPAALNGLQFLKGSFLKQPFQLVDGKLNVPVKPGLGVEVDEEAVLRANRGASGRGRVSSRQH